MKVLDEGESRKTMVQELLDLADMLDNEPIMQQSIVEQATGFNDKDLLKLLNEFD